VVDTGGQIMGQIVHELRDALRMLIKRPSFSAVVVITLALGIGANTAIFTVVDAALLRGLPYKDPERLVQIQENASGEIETQRDGSGLNKGEPWKHCSKTFATVSEDC
jgi:hypothetical protein